jgi:hypothetical protein
VVVDGPGEAFVVADVGGTVQYDVDAVTDTPQGRRVGEVRAYDLRRGTGAAARWGAPGVAQQEPDPGRRHGLRLPEGRDDMTSDEAAGTGDEYAWWQGGFLPVGRRTAWADEPRAAVNDR